MLDVTFIDDALLKTITQRCAFEPYQLLSLTIESFPLACTRHVNGPRYECSCRLVDCAASCPAEQARPPLMKGRVCSTIDGSRVWVESEP